MKSGTSHEDWIGNVGDVFRKVTVDCPKAPFSHDLIGSMAKQAGVTRKTIYDAHFGRGAFAKRQDVPASTPKNPGSASGSTQGQ
jgi:hypothetical protein